MSLIQCPECGARISSKATSCPHCGYVGEQPSLPIGGQDGYEIIPAFRYELTEWPPETHLAPVLPHENNKALMEYFGDWENILAAAPAVAQGILDMAQRDTVYVAKMTPYVKKLMAQGKLAFQFDKNGEIMAILKNVKSQKWAKQLRLEEAQVNPQFGQSLNNLTTLAYMTQILDEIESVGETIKELHIELQNDRLALAEAAWDKMLQVQEIRDGRLREAATMEAIASATEAKHLLMRNFSQCRKQIERESGKGQLQLMVEAGRGGNPESAASDAFQDLISITNAVQVECQGYAALGEYEASKQSLMQFKRFIEDNKLDDRDTLLLINGALKEKQVGIVREFSDIARQIGTIDDIPKLETGTKEPIPLPPISETEQERDGEDERSAAKSNR